MPIAIVLSGGGAKGDIEVGALRFIYDQGARQDILCGTSVGSMKTPFCVGACFPCNVLCKNMEFLSFIF
jgi:predicted acylesterase/phospholipase RssA